MGAITGTSAHRWEKFFDRLAQAYSVTNALAYAKLERATAYREKRENPYIARRWEEALAAGVEFLEDTARKRAVEGVAHTTGVYYQGECIAVETEIKYSDRLLLSMLAARNPAYRLDSGSQVQQQVMQELAKMLDLLQKKLPTDVYAQIIDVLAVGDDGVIDVSPENSARAQIAASESTEPST